MVIRETRSVCPVCLNPVAAQLIEDNGAIYLHKECIRHGAFKLLVSKFPERYKELNRVYCYLMQQNNWQREYYICLTNSCNINCHICYLKYCGDNAHNATPDDVSMLIVKAKGVRRFTFSHGEATIHPDLCKIIRLLKKQKKLTNIHTNGIEISDFNYMSALKEAGIDHISLQFDGFEEEVYALLRKRGLLEYKLLALENLKKLSIPVTLNATIARGVNEEQIGKIFDYAVKETFIKDISFITYSNYESTQDNMGKYLMPEDLLPFIEQHTNGAISVNSIILFQKLYYAYICAFKKKKCFNYYHFLVIRKGRGFVPINEIINLRRFERMLNSIIEKRKKVTIAAFLLTLFLSLNFRKSIYLIDCVALLFKGWHPGRPHKLLAITFASICDPYKYDAFIAGNCGQGIFYDKKLYASYGAFLMEELSKQRSQKENCLC